MQLNVQISYILATLQSSPWVGGRSVVYYIVVGLCFKNLRCSFFYCRVTGSEFHCICTCYTKHKE